MANKKKRKVSSGVGAVQTSGRAKSGKEFAPDYTYIKKDLKTIGTLAVSFFVILVVLSFILG